MSYASVTSQVRPPSEFESPYAIPPVSSIAQQFADLSSARDQPVRSVTEGRTYPVDGGYVQEVVSTATVPRPVSAGRGNSAPPPDAVSTVTVRKSETIGTPGPASDAGVASVAGSLSSRSGSAAFPRLRDAVAPPPPVPLARPRPVTPVTPVAPTPTAFAPPPAAATASSDKLGWVAVGRRAPHAEPVYEALPVGGYGGDSSLRSGSNASVASSVATSSTMRRTQTVVRSVGFGTTTTTAIEPARVSPLHVDTVYAPVKFVSRRELRQQQRAQEAAATGGGRDLTSRIRYSSVPRLDSALYESRRYGNGGGYGSAARGAASPYSGSTTGGGGGSAMRAARSSGGGGSRAPYAADDDDRAPFAGGNGSENGRRSSESNGHRRFATPPRAFDAGPPAGVGSAAYYGGPPQRAGSHGDPWASPVGSVAGSAASRQGAYASHAAADVADNNGGEPVARAFYAHNQPRVRSGSSSGGTPTRGGGGNNGGEPPRFYPFASSPIGEARVRSTTPLVRAYPSSDAGSTAGSIAPTRVGPRGVDVAKIGAMLAGYRSVPTPAPPAYTQEAFQLLHRGTYLIKYGRSGNPHERFFALRMIADERTGHAEPFLTWATHADAVGYKDRLHLAHLVQAAAGSSGFGMSRHMLGPDRVRGPFIGDERRILPTRHAFVLLFQSGDRARTVELLALDEQTLRCWLLVAGYLASINTAAGAQAATGVEELQPESPCSVSAMSGH